MPFEDEGTLTTESREVEDTETWDSDSDWNAAESSNNIEVVDDSIRLAETDNGNGNGTPSSVETHLDYWYPVDEGSGSTISDALENGPDHTLTDTTWVSDSDFWGGSALEYNGSTSMTAADSSISVTGDQLSVCGWLNFDTLQSSNEGIFGAGSIVDEANESGEDGITLGELDGDTVKLWSTEDGETLTLLELDGGSVSSDEWYFIAYAVEVLEDETDASIYLWDTDGLVESADDPDTGGSNMLTPDLSDITLYTGQFDGSGFDGIIDSFGYNNGSLLSESDFAEIWGDTEGNLNSGSGSSVLLDSQNWPDGGTQKTMSLSDLTYGHRHRMASYFEIDGWHIIFYGTTESDSGEQHDGLQHTINGAYSSDLENWTDAPNNPLLRTNPSYTTNRMVGASVEYDESNDEWIVLHQTNPGMSGGDYREAAISYTDDLVTVDNGTPTFENDLTPESDIAFGVDDIGEWSNTDVNIQPRSLSQHDGSWYMHYDNGDDYTALAKTDDPHTGFDDMDSLNPLSTDGLKTSEVHHFDDHWYITAQSHDHSGSEPYPKFLRLIHNDTLEESGWSVTGDLSTIDDHMDIELLSHTVMVKTDTDPEEYELLISGFTNIDFDPQRESELFQNTIS